MHLMTYDDRKLFATELNYSVHEKKSLTIKHSLRFIILTINIKL